MGVSAKARRKITVDGKDYVWAVQPDLDGPCRLLNIISQDKRLILCCPLKANTPYLISKGAMFQGRPAGGRWQRYLLPFCVPEAVTPRFVHEVILWAARGKEAVRVNWNPDDRPV